MTLRHLRIFVTVYQELSMTKASKKLHLAQPSVSLAVKELEQYYGICLFDRISRRLYPTQEGEMLYDYALHIVSLFDEMEENISDKGKSGIIRAGASVTIGNFLMPGLVDRFTAEYPEVRVQVTVNNSEFLETAVLNNQLDFALTEGRIEHPQIIREAFLEDSICFICHPAHPLTQKAEGEISFDMLADCPFVLRERGSAGREIVEEAMKYRQRRLNIVWESLSTQAIVRAVAKNIGLSALPYMLVEKDIQEGRVARIPFDMPALHREFAVICHQNKYLSAGAREFIRMAKEYTVEYPEGCQEDMPREGSSNTCKAGGKGNGKR